MCIDNHLLLSLASLRKQRLENTDPVASQEKLLLDLVRGSARTAIGKAHDFASVRTGRGFLERVAPKSYDDFEADIGSIVEGEPDVLFPGHPR